MMKCSFTALIFVGIISVAHASRQPEQRIVQSRRATSAQHSQKATQTQEAATNETIQGVLSATAQTQKELTDSLNQAKAQENQNVTIERKLAKYTLWLVIVGVIQFVALIAQGTIFFFTLRIVKRQTRVLQRQSVSMKDAVIATRQGNQINREISQAVQRAYIAFPLLDVQQMAVKSEAGAFVRWELRTAVENTGNTPARDLYIYANCCCVDGNAGLPDNFSFPDFGTGENFPFQLAAKGKTYSAKLPLEYGVANQVYEKKARLYFYGWAMYKDVFDSTIIHRTEFCHEVGILKIGDGLLLEMSVHRLHNSQT